MKARLYLPYLMTSDTRADQCICNVTTASRVGAVGRGGLTSILAGPLRAPGGDRATSASQSVLAKEGMASSPRHSALHDAPYYNFAAM